MEEVWTGKKFGKLVTYVDDLVILCRGDRIEQALQELRKIMDKLKLTVNEEKTRICKVPHLAASVNTLE